MKSIGWRIEYEPYIEGLNGWLPDFLIIGKRTKILVEVKPFNCQKDFSSEYGLSTHKKIVNSNWRELGFDGCIVVGASLDLDDAQCAAEEETFVGGTIMRFDFPENYRNYKNPTNLFDMIDDFFVYTDHAGKIGICDDHMSFEDIIHSDHRGHYCLDKSNKEKLKTCWNEAGSKLQWMPK